MTITDVGLTLATLAVVGLVYPHAIYPMVLSVVHRWKRRPARVGPYVGDVTVVIAAYNETASIGDCLASIRGATAAPERVHVIVADDGSTDDTAAVAEHAAALLVPMHVRVLRCARGGKNAAIRQALEHTHTDVVVFTDADCRLQPRALGRLLAPFHDPSIGATIGLNDRSGAAFEESGAQQEAQYRVMENRVNVMESEIASTAMSSGALYAVRTSCLRPIPDRRVADDWWNVLCAVRAGLRVVMVPGARVVEYRANTMTQEFRRTIRTASSGMRCVWSMRSLLHPRQGWTSWFLISHRVLRWAGPWFLILMAIATPLVVQHTLAFGVLFYGQLAVYTLAYIGHAAERMGTRLPLVSTLLYIVLMNATFLLAAFRAIGGDELDAWTPDQGGERG